MTGKYVMVLKSPMGPKRGFININEEAGGIEGSMECLGQSHTFSGRTTADGRIVLEGVLQTPMGEEPFTINGSIKENILTADFRRRNECYDLLGMMLETEDIKR